MRKVVWSTWPACIEADPLRPLRPFRATAVIANPPCVSHIHCAEALQVHHMSHLKRALIPPQHAEYACACCLLDQCLLF